MGGKFQLIFFFVVLVTICPSFQYPDEYDICSLPPVVRTTKTCRASLRKWTYNNRRGVCERFTYKGCGGTKNLFNSEAQCLATCNRRNFGGAPPGFGSPFGGSDFGGAPPSDYDSPFNGPGFKVTRTSTGISCSNGVCQCTYNGKKYNDGDVIDVGNPCKKCVCSEEWAGLDSCKNISCSKKSSRTSKASKKSFKSTPKPARSGRRGS